MNYYILAKRGEGDFSFLKTMDFLFFLLENELDKEKTEFEGFYILKEKVLIDELVDYVKLSSNGVIILNEESLKESNIK